MSVPPDLTWVQAYEGLPMPDIVDVAEADGHQVRVVRAGDAMTLDYRPTRLNVVVDDDDRVLRVFGG
jgi:hypothetical protein